MTALIMLPGMMCDERLFTPQIEVLSTEHEVRVASICNYSTIQQLAAAVLADAPATFALAGLSMGGIVAMEICAQAPNRVEKLALMDTNPKAELDEVKQKREPQIKSVTAGKLHEVIRDEMKPNYLVDSERKHAIEETCMAMALSLGADVFVRQSQALRDRPDQQKTLRSLKIPTLILCGEQDKLCPIDRHELMQALIPDSNLVVIQNAGHMPTLEQPKKTTEALKTWLSQ
jgi:pimeloyl-ACP methyl ester carboxylesterase